MKNIFNLSFTLRRDTPEYALGVLGFLWAAQVEKDQLAEQAQMDGLTPESMEQVLALGFTLPLASVDADGNQILNRDMPVRPALFNVADWNNLLNGCTFETNLMELDQAPDDVLITFKASGINEVANEAGYLALFRFVREYLVVSEELQTVMTWANEDPEVLGDYVLFTKGSEIGYVKNVGDIDQALDVGWNLEIPYSENAQLIMRNFVTQMGQITRTTTASLKDRSNANTSLFKTLTGLNKMLISYLEAVSFKAPLGGDDHGADFEPWLVNAAPDEMEINEIDPGLVHILSGLLAIGIVRMLKSGTRLVPTVNAKGKLPYGNSNALRDFRSNLEMLFPYAAQTAVRNEIRNYLDYYA